MELDRCRAERMRRDAKNSLDMVRSRIQIIVDNAHEILIVNCDQYEVWGKSGPGGAPWRNPRQVGQSFMKSMGWTDKTLLQTLDPDKKQSHEVDQRANGHDKSDISDKNQLKLPTQCCINCFCDCKPKYTPTNVNGKENVENATITQKENQDNAFRLCEHTNRCAKKCKYVKPRTCMITGGVELVPLLARRRAMQRPISLSTTDVTKYPTNKKFVIQNVFILEQGAFFEEKKIELICCLCFQVARLW